MRRGNKPRSQNPPAVLTGQVPVSGNQPHAHEWEWITDEVTGRRSRWCPECGKTLGWR